MSVRSESDNDSQVGNVVDPHENDHLFAPHYCCISLRIGGTYENGQLMVQINKRAENPCQEMLAEDQHNIHTVNESYDSLYDYIKDLIPQAFKDNEDYKLNNGFGVFKVLIGTANQISIKSKRSKNPKLYQKCQRILQEQEFKVEEGEDYIFVILPLSDMLPAGLRGIGSAHNNPNQRIETAISQRSNNCFTHLMVCDLLFFHYVKS